MKFIANHRIDIGSAPNVQILHAGQVLPPMDVQELLRLQDLVAITGAPSDATEAIAPAPKSAKKADAASA